MGIIDEKESNTYIYNAKLICDSIMDKYSPDELPPKGVFFYHQGVFLSGMQRLYLLSGERKYFDYIKDYVDSVIGPNGEIYGMDYEATDWKDNAGYEENLKLHSLTMLDSKQPVILLYNLYDETKEKKYKKAIETISESMYFWPVNTYGGYWHMMDQHNQMWLDGAYMAGVLSVMYSARFGDYRLRERAISQIFIMEENMLDKQTGLLYHGWDPSKQMLWADPKTGLSSQIWGRAVGWYLVAILDMLDFIPQDNPATERLKSIVCNVLKSLVKFQDKKSGLWFEVVDKPERQDNWTESSCSCLFTYSYAKAIRKGILDENYECILEKAYNGAASCMYYDEKYENFVVDKVCIGTCIEDGTYEHYINRKQIKNDLHGSGAFVLMCTEMEYYRRWKENI